MEARGAQLALVIRLREHQRMGKAVLWSLAVLIGLYLAAMGLAFVKQRAIIYPAPPVGPQASDLPSGFRQLALQTSDGLRLKALYRPARGDLPTLVFFHGNGDDLQGALAAMGVVSGQARPDGN